MARKKVKSLDDIGEHSILANYPEAEALSRIVDSMRIGVLNNEEPSWDSALNKQAKREIRNINRIMDESRYQFDEALYRFAFPDKPRPRVLMFVQGGFYGRTRRAASIEDTVIVRDLRTNAWPLHKDQHLENSKTLDTMVTLEAAAAWCADHREELGKMRFRRFLIDKSAYFYVASDEISEKDHRIFYPGGDFDPDAIAPFVYDTGGFLGTRHVGIPDEEMYQAHAPTFQSSRIKNSEAPRITNLLLKDRYVFRDMSEVMSDWAGHRLVFQDSGETTEFASNLQRSCESGEPLLLRPSPRSSGFTAEVVYFEDRYTKPKKSEYRDYKALLRVSSPSFGTHTRELQMTDKMSYYNHEINRNHPAHHIKRELEKQDQIDMIDIEGEKRAEIVNGCLMELNRLFGEYHLPYHIPRIGAGDLNAPH